MPMNGVVAPAAADASTGAGLNRQRYWRRVRWLTTALLLAWLVVSFSVVFDARRFSFPFFGWPFSFWWAAQGAPLAFLALVALYALAMNRLDERHGLDEQD